jgi:hypothetical protein
MDTARRTLHRLLDAGADFAPEYGGGLSSHLPMALQALQALGAGAQRLEAFQERYAPRLSAPGRAGAGAHPEGYEQRVRQLDAELRLEGRDAVLRRRLPALLEDPGAAAFHGLIRVAHGVAAGHAGELARGLAYWSAVHRPGGQAPASAGAALPLDAWLARLRALHDRHRVTGRRISWRMQAWREVPGVEIAAGALALDETTLPALAHAAARLYARTGDFTVLHVITASHALRGLWPWVTDRAAALRALRPALAAALLASDAWEAGAAVDADAAAPPCWEELVRGALAADDEHVIKLVHACRDWDDWDDRQGGAVFARAAARALA